MEIRTVYWEGGIDGYAQLIDQTLLPVEYKVISIKTTEQMWDAIKRLQVRGAPAIGIAAAYGLVLGIRDSNSHAELVQAVNANCDYLNSSRPTAINLAWALQRMKTLFDSFDPQDNIVSIKDQLLAHANHILGEDIAMCKAIGQHGAKLINKGDGILTHCNAGALATGGYGTALSLMYVAHEQGKSFQVFADETRPLLQGSRLTAWELQESGIDVTVICDNMAGLLMRQGKINMVVTGADCIASNGDAANKIGTYSVAILAKAHNIPFYIAAPYSTFDFSIQSGDEIPIEERSPDEIICGFGKQTAPATVKTYNPAFDVSPADLIAGIITEKGILRPPFIESIEDFRLSMT